MSSPVSRMTGLFDGPGKAQRVVVFLKMTYRLTQHGPMRRAPRDSPLVVETVSEGPDERFALGCTVQETDLWELKPCTDVVVSGHVRASGQRPVATMDAGISVGGREKWVRVFGDRHVVYRSGRPCFTEPEPFVTKELTWRRAYGGVDLTVPHAEPHDVVTLLRLFSPEDHPGAYPRNPAGRGWMINDVPSAIDGMALPNFETPTQLLSPSDLIVRDRRLWTRAPIPAGFGWWRQGWFPRSVLMGLSHSPFVDDDARGLPEVQSGWVRADQIDRPEPDSLFQSGASPGLRFAKIAAGERIVLHGFSPEGAIDTRLPTAAPEIEMTFERRQLATNQRLATVELLPDVGLANLVWVAHASPPARLPRKMPRPGQNRYEILEGVEVSVDGEPVPNEVVSLREEAL